MNFANLKSLNIGGVELKALSIDGVQVWKKLVTLFNGTTFWSEDCNSSTVVHGVTFSWDNDNKILTMNGTATANIASVAAYSCEDVNLPAGNYTWHCKVVGGSYTYITNPPFFRAGNKTIGTTKYPMLPNKPITQYFENVTVFAPRLDKDSVYNNWQVQIIVEEA